jgi:hypothetical protein
VLIFQENYDGLAPVLLARIDNLAAKLLRLHVRVVNLIYFMPAEDENMNKNSHNFLKQLV